VVPVKENHKMPRRCGSGSPAGDIRRASQPSHAKACVEKSHDRRVPGRAAAAAPPGLLKINYMKVILVLFERCKENKNYFYYNIFQSS